jgi:hypothetical protein
MTTGDEPMLPHPADDNAPMISGRGTKIIADARGAYLAGNLHALIEHMDEMKQSSYRQFLQDEAIKILNRVLIAVGLNDQIEHPFLQTLNIVVTERSSQQFPEIYDLLWDWQPLEQVKILGEAIALFISIFETRTLLGVSSDWYFLIGSAANTLHLNQVNDQFLSRFTFGQGEADLRQWQLDAAWSILQGKEPPPFEMPS